MSATIRPVGLAHGARVAAHPDSIGRFVVVRLLGRGGMGKLYLARDPAIGRQVAIKLLRDDPESPEIRERFLREARAAGSLRHLNIVTIFDIGEHDDQPFIAMEFVDGDTLGEIIRRKDAVPLGRRLEWMETLCSGLAYAHRAGIVHRDVKPANVMVDRDGTLKILDFGIARAGASGMTRTGMVLGTVCYMAPEQLSGGVIDQRSDIFAVGAVFFELMSGRRAFPGDAEAAFLQRLNKPEPDSLGSVCPESRSGDRAHRQQGPRGRSRAALRRPGDDGPRDRSCAAAAGAGSMGHR